MKRLLVGALCIMLIPRVTADHGEMIFSNHLARIAVPFHIIEIGLALFACYMALKFFSITKPVSLFLWMYVGFGFFIVSSLLYVFMFLLSSTAYEVSFVGTYLTSRISLIAMIISFTFFFYQWNASMRQLQKKTK